MGLVLDDHPILLSVVQHALQPDDRCELIGVRRLIHCALRNPLQARRHLLNVNADDGALLAHNLRWRAETQLERLPIESLAHLVQAVLNLLTRAPLLRALRTLVQQLQGGVEVGHCSRLVVEVASL